MLLANGHFVWVTPAIFVIFIDFRGLRSKLPCFCRQNAISESSPIFVKTTCLQRARRHRFPKRPLRQRRLEIIVFGGALCAHETSLRAPWKNAHCTEKGPSSAQGRAHNSGNALDASLLCFQGLGDWLSGPLNWLNAILSLLHPLDRYRTPSAIGSAIGRPLSRPISHPDTGGSPQPPRSKPLRGLNRAIVAL